MSASPHSIRKTSNSHPSQSGSVIVAILLVMMFLSTIVLGLVTISKSNLVRARGRIMLLQAQYAAESGADSAVAYFNAGNTSYTGTTGDVTVLNGTQYKATYAVTVANGSSAKEKIITSTGKVYAPVAASVPKFTRTIRVTADRTSTTSASSLVSRNIVEINSGVKNLTAKDIYVNGFIHLNKNTTNLIGESITVAGKYTGSGNCSIAGTGNLIKPTTFSTPGQTKTQIRTTYNNCLSPPGNTSNADFDVFANQGSISTIQSMYIPWSQYMDATYTDAGSCSDWTSGASPRSIPSIAGSKATHYPDSGSNVATSCGTSGNIDLGFNQYNISDNVHIRANLCATAACHPTFNNTTSSLIFIFVEGTVNFDKVTTAAGSGPIAIVAYGTDPSSKSSVCPYGGSVYLGNDDTDAPDLYLLATNGICLDKTKFSASPALGGLGGKNIYVSTNPGTPFDLALDTAFPTSQIPIDLAWRATRYERL